MCSNDNFFRLLAYGLSIQDFPICVKNEPQPTELEQIIAKTNECRTALHLRELGLIELGLLTLMFGDSDEVVGRFSYQFIPQSLDLEKDRRKLISKYLNGRKGLLDLRGLDRSDDDFELSNIEAPLLSINLDYSNIGRLDLFECKFNILSLNGVFLDKFNLQRVNIGVLNTKGIFVSTETIDLNFRCDLWYSDSDDEFRLDGTGDFIRAGRILTW